MLDLLSLLRLTIDDGTGGAMDLTDKSTGQPVATSVLSGQTINLHRPSIVNSSSHTWEFAGSGTNYLALPENGGTKIEAYEQVSEQYGRVYVLVLTNLVTSRLVHSLESKTELVLLPLLVRLPSLKLNS